MPRELAYNTHSAVPSDYECADGELAMSLGAIYEDNALKPIMQPSSVLRMRDGEYVAFIHKTTAYTHYIINSTGDSKILWVDETTIDADTLIGEYKELPFDYSGLTIYGFNAVGNTLVILTDDGMYYFLWKNDNEAYLALGNHMPELPISFGLQGTMYQNYSDEYDDKPEERETFEITYKEDDDDIEKIWNDDKFSEWGEAKKSSITAQVLAKVNKFIANRATNKGRFIFPFFVRYAYRLYDDSLTMHSAPILMAANSKCVPIVGITDESGSNGRIDIGDTSATCIVIGMVHDLDYMIEDNDSTNTGSAQSAEPFIDQVNKWSDIIKSVDVFISAPLYTYDQSGECERFVDSYTRTDEDYGYCVCSAQNDAYRLSDNSYKKWLISQYYMGGSFDGVLPQYHVELPNREDTAMEEIADIANFYLLKSIPIEDLPTTSARVKIDIEDDYLGALVTRERMTDDYDSHDTLIPHYSFGYNSRLNTANLTKRFFDGYDPYAIFQFRTRGSGAYMLNYYIHIRYEMTDMVIRHKMVYDYGYNPDTAPLLYFYYPSTDAYKVTFEWNGKYYELPLTSSDFLNGAYAFASFDDILDSATTPDEDPKETANDTAELPNKIYTSEVNDPFFFPLSGINTVGTGYIMALCAAAKALSQGQFGEFPLYAFCSDGVWALSISAEGLYTAVQPITRDVCINTDSITQLDSSVLFATDRGIMHISGSSLECISDRINSPAPFSLSALPKAEGVIAVYNKMAVEEMQLTLDEIDMIPFLDYIATCQMVYDYVNQHIIMYNTDKRYAYVFSLKSSAWGMLYSTAFSSVNFYPDAMANANVTINGETLPTLVDYSHPTVTDTTALILTRPFTLDSANSLKTIDTVIQRGMFPKKNIRQVLYGSRELYNWFVVRSSVDCYLRGFSGTPFKAFRLAMVCKLKQAETLYGATVEFTGRMANQPR